MRVHLKSQGQEFKPSISGFQGQNYTLKPTPEEFMKIKRAAFKSYSLPMLDTILMKTLNSGVCSGISAYTLNNFWSKELNEGDPGFLIPVFQARTWGGAFLRQGFSSYFSSLEKVIQRTQEGIVEEKDPCRLPLLVFLPRLFYWGNISLAHTVVPFKSWADLENIYFGLYDSNYPGDDTKFLAINKTTGLWQYQDKSSKEWVLTINYLGNLTHRANFLL